VQTRPERRRGRRVLGWIGLVFLVGILLFILYVVRVSVHRPPPVEALTLPGMRPAGNGEKLVIQGRNWFRQTSDGIYEMYVEGEPYARGLSAGQLSGELVRRQEEHFQDQIKTWVPSAGMRWFLKYFIGWFNRHLDDNVPMEYRREIYGISQAASHDFDEAGTPYSRLLNYHAAHDIGHALQNMMLVGCTSFAAWGDRTADGGLLVGRNFDFYAGEEFAKEKIVSFVRPDSGYAFMSVTWGGFIGVVSGMNEQGLTVTINALPSRLPAGSATPVSLETREILQYARTIDEAMRIAGSRKMFVSESFLVSSTADRRAVVIEKTPDGLAVVEPSAGLMTCTNHYQSQDHGRPLHPPDDPDVEASTYRMARLNELIDRAGKLSPDLAASILRDRNGLEDRPIGQGNEKAINQLIAHHAVIFQPDRLLAWVSEAPYQLGRFRVYDLRSVLASDPLQTGTESPVDSLSIPADSFMLTDTFARFQTFRYLQQRILRGLPVDPDSLVALNPLSSLAYALAADQAFRREAWGDAEAWYQKALALEPANEADRRHLEEGLQAAREKKSQRP